MQSLIDLIDDHTPLGPPLDRLIVIGVFVTAALGVVRASGRVAELLVRHGERRRREDTADTGVIESLRQRETAIALIQTSVTYGAFALAFLLSLGTLLGAQQTETVVGASFLALLLAFSAQRFLADVIAGLLMFFEGWFRIGDTVTVEPWGLQGVVEHVSLRSLTIRSLSGEVMRVPNSEIKATRVSPRGFRELEVELFANDRDAGSELVERVGAIVPAGPAYFVRRPHVVESEELDGDLVRVRARAAVAPGREWLGEELLPELIRERAPEGVLLHGPIVSRVDDQAARRFARAVRSRSA